MGAPKGLNLAARLVADMYDAINRPDLSGMIRAGHADDFPEITAATALLEQDAARLDRYESALRQYADPGFWDDMTRAACSRCMMAATWQGMFLQVAPLSITGTDHPVKIHTKRLEGHDARLEP
jgi:hypothetical protein